VAEALEDGGTEPIWFDRLPPRRPRARFRPPPDRTGLAAALLGLLALTAIVAGVLVLYPLPGPPPVPLVRVQAVVDWTAPPHALNGSFWGINIGPNVASSTTLADEVAESPARVVRFPGGTAGDGFNYTSGMLTNATGVAAPADENLTEFVAWCRTVNCSPILELPGEIDAPATAAYYVAYTESTFGLHPVAWEIGNEPALWTHFGLPWNDWNASQLLTPTPLQYARVVQAYVVAIHAVDPTAPILGLPGVGTGAFQETSWLNATIAVNGPNISGVAIHVYPAGAGPGSSATLSEYLENASGPSSLGPRIAADEAAISEGRPGLPLYITELGTSLASGSFAPFLYSFPSVPFLASELVTAALSGVASADLSQVQTPHGGTWADGNGNVHPLLTLYTELLPQLGSSAFPVSLTPAVPGLFAMATSSSPGGPVELFVVNANSTTDVVLDLAGAGLNASAGATRWSWNSSTSTPIVVTLPSAPATWNVPDVSVLLVKTNGGAGVDVPAHAPATRLARGTGGPPPAGPTAAARWDP
jgi:hypothetical protein